MNFYERYEQVCRDRDLEPTGRKIESLMKPRVPTFSRTTPNKWKDNGNSPKGEVVAALADILQVSADYLLGRTVDETDHTKEQPTLTKKQKDLLKLFARLEEANQSDAMRYMDYLLSKQAEEKERASVTA